MKKNYETFSIFVPESFTELRKDLNKRRGGNSSKSKRARQLMVYGLEYEKLLNEGKISKINTTLKDDYEDEEIPKIISHTFKEVEVDPEEAKENIKAGLKNLKKWS